MSGQVVHVGVRTRPSVQFPQSVVGARRDSAGRPSARRIAEGCTKRNSSARQHNWADQQGEPIVVQ